MPANSSIVHAFGSTCSTSTARLDRSTGSLLSSTIWIIRRTIARIGGEALRITCPTSIFTLLSTTRVRGLRVVLEQGYIAIQTTLLGLTRYGTVYSAFDNSLFTSWALWQEVDFEQVATETDEELQQLSKKWFAVLAQTDMSDPTNCFRTGLLRLAFSYARLIALSFGFQHAFGKNNTDENPFFLRVSSGGNSIPSLSLIRCLQVPRRSY